MKKPRKRRLIARRNVDFDFHKVKVVPLLTCDEVVSTFRRHGCDILLLLAITGTLCVTEIAQRLRLCTSVASRVLGRLLERKLVRYEPDLNFHRFHLGEAIRARVRSAWVQLGVQLPNADWFLLKRQVPRSSSPGLGESQRLAHGGCGRHSKTPPRLGTNRTESGRIGRYVRPMGARRQSGAALDLAWDSLFLLFGTRRYEILTFVALEGQMRPGRILQRLGGDIPASSVSRDLKHLREAHLLEHVGDPNRHCHQLGRCIHAPMTLGRVDLAVRVVDGSWMVMHREEFSESDRPIPLPTEWVDDPSNLVPPRLLPAHVRVDEVAPHEEGRGGCRDIHGRCDEPMEMWPARVPPIALRHARSRFRQTS